MNIVIDVDCRGINPLSIRKGEPLSIKDGVLCYIDNDDSSQVYVDLDKIATISILPNGFNRKPDFDEFFRTMLGKKEG